MSKKIRWAIIGTGGVSHKFASGLKVLRGAELAAVASRNIGTARAFAKEFGIPKYYAPYERLAEDGEIDVVYIGTVNTQHCENVLMCVNSGKAVLCEKPFAINAAEAKKMVASARRNKVFLMDALWPRFMPGYVLLRRLLDSGVIGKIRVLRADFGANIEYSPKARHYNLATGGGSLLDIGVYNINLAYFVFGGWPKEAVSLADFAANGADNLQGLVFKYDTGSLAVLTSANSVKTVREAFIYGTQGYIKLEEQIYNPLKVTVCAGGKTKVYRLRASGHQFNYEAGHVMECVRKGLIESPVMPHRETVEIMETMDKIRGQWKLKYPMEK